MDKRRAYTPPDLGAALSCTNWHAEAFDPCRSTALLPDADADAEEDDALRSGLLDVKMQAVEWVYKRHRQRENFYDQHDSLNTDSTRMKRKEQHVDIQQKLSSLGCENDLRT